MSYLYNLYQALVHHQSVSLDPEQLAKVTPVDYGFLPPLFLLDFQIYEETYGRMLRRFLPVDSVWIESVVRVFHISHRDDPCAGEYLSRTFKDDEISETFIINSNWPALLTFDLYDKSAVVAGVCAERGYTEMFNKLVEELADHLPSGADHIERELLKILTIIRKAPVKFLLVFTCIPGLLQRLSKREEMMNPPLSGSMPLSFPALSNPFAQQSSFSCGGFAFPPMQGPFTSMHAGYPQMAFPPMEIPSAFQPTRPEAIRNRDKVFPAIPPWVNVPQGFPVPQPSPPKAAKPSVSPKGRVSVSCIALVDGVRCANPRGGLMQNGLLSVLCPEHYCINPLGGCDFLTIQKTALFPCSSPRSPGSRLCSEHRSLDKDPNAPRLPKPITNSTRCILQEDGQRCQNYAGSRLYCRTHSHYRPETHTGTCWMTMRDKVEGRPNSRIVSHCLENAIEKFLCARHIHLLDPDSRQVINVPVAPQAEVIPPKKE